jgi:addiction module RelE/StbE family toxin
VTIEYNRTFKKHFRSRVLPKKNLFNRYEERLEVFLKDRKSPVINDHKLVGSMKGTRAFDITGNIRVVYIEVAKNYFIFLDIGTHPQVYRM